MRIRTDSYLEIQSAGGLKGEDKKIYLKLCSELTSRNPNLNYQEITTNLMDYLKKYAYEQINKLELNEILTNLITTQMDNIFNNKKIYEDNNYIGRINIVSLQVILLFTKIALKGDNGFKVNANNVYKCYEKLISADFLDYDNIKELITTKQECNRMSVLYLNEDTKKPYSTDTSPDTLIFLVTIVDYFSLDQILTDFLQNVIMCGVASTYLWADGRYLTPFEFLEHDITHGNNYKAFCYDRMHVSRDDMSSFYHFCKEKIIDDKQKLYSIKFMMFLLIHEGFCDFFNKNATKRNIFYSGLLNIGRFFDSKTNKINENDLGLLIPKTYRDSIEKVNTYLDKALQDYIESIQSWEKSQYKEYNDPDKPKEPNKPSPPAEEQIKKDTTSSGGKRRSRRKSRRRSRKKSRKSKKSKRKSHRRRTHRKTKK